MARSPSRKKNRDSDEASGVVWAREGAALDSATAKTGKIRNLFMEKGLGKRIKEKVVTAVTLVVSIWLL
jgi:hypothetical protein